MNEMNADSERQSLFEKAQINVVIVCHDLKKARSLSVIFREVGVLPYVCTSLSEFWEEINQNTPHLCVVDVKMMSQGQYLFKDHPKVKSEQLPTAFVYDDSSAALLYSTYDLLNLGLINSDQGIKGQVKSVLKRYNSFQNWQKKAEKAQESQDRLDTKLSSLVRSAEQLKEKSFYQSYLKSLQGRMESLKDGDDFLASVAQVFSGQKEFKKFTFLELSPSKQKLVSPKLFFDKYAEVPSLWLGKGCEGGIEFFAQNMASQVCLELMGGDLMSLLIKGRTEEPEVMIFIQVEGEDFLGSFDWESLERYLSGLYCHYELKFLTARSKDTTTTMAWELYSILDDIRYGSISENRIQGGYERYALIGIDFSTLTAKAFDQGELRFYWKKFITDFMSGLETQKGLNFRAFFHDINHMSLLVDKVDLENYINQINAYCMRYPFWRYFEDADVVLGANLKPEVRVLPMSSSAIENWCDQSGVKAVENTVESKEVSPVEGFYHPGNEHNM